jgi:hypothetical protein
MGMPKVGLSSNNLDFRAFFLIASSTNASILPTPISKPYDIIRTHCADTGL